MNALAAAANSPWTGRVDGDGPAHARWHQMVQEVGAPRATATGSASSAPAPDGTSADTASPHPAPDASHPHIALLGFASDEGVRRNMGRVGAADGPRALRSALASMALHGPLGTGEIALLDHGDARTEGEDLEGGQERMGAAIAEALTAAGCRLAVVLGGGHETAWPSYLGLQRAIEEIAPNLARPRWGVLNLDAHFDLRSADAPSSGTPFLQMAVAEAGASRLLNYAVIGIAEPSNTAVLFERAEKLGVKWLTDTQCAEGGAAAITRFIEDFARDLDVLYLTIDLDVLPASVAPGVSAPAAIGVDPALILHAVRVAAGTGRMRLLDVVELNPRLDIDNRTAKTAARLISEAASITAAHTSGDRAGGLRAEGGLRA